MNKNFILKDKLNIYNNLAQSGSSVGRLSVVYNIYPTPAIFWEFETDTRSSALPNYDANYNITSPFTGHLFYMPDSRAGAHDETQKHESNNPFLRGSAPTVFLGDLKLTGKIFSFYIPNAKFQVLSWLGKNFIVKEFSYEKPNRHLENHEKAEEDIEPKFGGGHREGFVEAKLGDGIKIELHTH